jgi:N-acetyl-anhydromuramyl-L-alanine amidase AmpD
MDYFDARNAKIAENEAAAKLSPEQMEVLDKVLTMMRQLDIYGVDVLASIDVDHADVEKIIEGIETHFNYQGPDEELAEPELSDAEALASAGRGTDEDYVPGEIL